MRKTILHYGIITVFFLTIANLAFAQQSFYVNDNGTTGDVYTSAPGNNANPGTPASPFASINYAISQAQAGDTIWVDAGTYIENVFVDKSLTFKGAKAGINPGASLDRSNETVVQPSGNDIQNGIVFNVRTTNITIDGFLIDGDNPAISGGANINGVDVNAGMGVFNQQLLVNGLRVKNNIFKNFNRYGVFLRRLNQPTVTEDNQVTNNRFDNINNSGVGMFNNAYATVTNGHFTRTVNGIFFGNGTIASTLEILIANNYIEAPGTNIAFGAMSASSLNVSIINNTLNTVGSIVSGTGIGLGSLTTSGSLWLTNNVISNKQNGIDISSITAPGGVYIQQGSVINSTGVGLLLTAQNTNFAITNLALNNNAVGIDASGIGTAFGLIFSNVSINGGTTGIRFYGTGLTLPANKLTGVSFSGQTKEYIFQTANSFNGQTIDASAAVFDGLAPTSMTLAQLFATEDKLTHRIDFNDVGYFKLKPNEVFITPNSFAATLHPSFGVATTSPDINRAVAAAATGDIIHIAAGTYVGQVFLDKAITLQGAGIGATVINAGTATPVNLPNLPAGIVYSATAIGNVGIKNMTINSGNSVGAQYYGISLQTGGEISGCEINGAGSANGNGIYIQKDDSDPETISILSNHLHHIGFLSIKINVPHIIATVNNNVIDVSGSGYGMGLVAGGEPHLIDGLDFIGNKIIGVTGFGVKVNCSNSNVIISNNSFEKAASEFFTVPFIQNTGSNSINASCNWFGSADAEFVRSRIQGNNISYAPWLSNGTDNSSDIGFQPPQNVCNGRQTKFYVNDNSQSGDVFTVAIGSNANNGFASKPFATISYAISQAQSGDTIFVDAGTYAEQVTIDKGLIIIGAGRDNTLITPSALAYIAPPGFAEKALIQTVPNIGDVHIRDLSVTGDHPKIVSGIIMQTGGSVKNCKLQGGSQGVYIWVQSGIKNAVIENNIINAEVTAVNFQGSGLTVSLVNNSIVNSNPAGSAAVFFGLSLGPVAQTTISGNTISGLIFGGSMIGSITQNSIVGGPFAIGQAGGNAISATCNWFGTNGAEQIKSKIIGNVNYSPWLTDGTDNSSDIGFQPLANVCNGRQNKFYVNDASTTGDIFTTAIGNNANNGFSSTPFATLDYAISQAQNGDSIFVDAGTYVTPNVSIGKSITIIGINYNVSPNNPDDRLAINPTRNAEALIQGSTFLIASNDVTLQGLSFNPGAKSQITLLNTGVNNFTFKRNYSKITSGQFLTLNGPAVPSGQLPVFGNYLIEDNRFESQATLLSFCISVSNLNGLTVKANTFFTPSGFPQRILSSSAVSGTVSNYVYSNNISYAARNDWFSSGAVVTAKIENNISLQCQRSFVIQTGTINSEIEVRNNYLQSDFFELSPVQYLNSGTATAGLLANLLIENNTIIQNPAGRTSVPAAILAQGFTLGSNTRTTIRNNKINFTGNYNSLTSSNILGVSFTGRWKAITVEENEIAFNGTNLPNTLPASGPVTSGIAISSDSGPNTIPVDAVINIKGNKVSGFKNSIAVYDGSNAAPNSFVGYGNLSIGITTTITNNSFTADSISINNGTVGQAVNANCNWYGSAAYQLVAGKVLNGLYPSWLTNGTDNDATIGFQPVSGSCDGTPAVLTLNNATNITCSGVNNGTITISVSGGKAPYAFQWNKDDEAYSNTEDLTNLSPGTYSVTVTDANGSTATITDIIISEPLLLTAAPNGTNVSCFGGANGYASVTAEGGTAPYSYLWNNGATTESISGVVAGVYSVTITDANGCSVNASHEVTQPALLTATATPTSTACFNSILVAASGGTAPYTYLWSNGATTASMSSIAAGTYSVTVTDANGCSVTASATVTANEAFNPSASVTDVKCYGEANGSIMVTNVNAVAPFKYSIDGGLTYQNSATFSGLVAGTYTITVKDANGCTGFVTKTINQPAQLMVSLVSVQNTCFGQTSGSISVNVIGGTAGYTYSWTGPNGYSSAQKNISGLAAGNYVLTVTDSKECVASFSQAVTTTNQIMVNPTVTPIACKGETNGSISLNVSGGSGNGFNYLWNTAATSNSISNLGVGNYNVTITDIGTGCSISRSYTITQPASLVNLSTTKTNATGCASLGTITATGSGGTSGYQYKLDNGNYQTSGSFTGLHAGTYTVSVKDGNGCTKSSVVSITDNGSDEYEGNNSKNQAKPINTGMDVFALIAIATDAADWFRFTTAISGNYTITLTHPTSSFTFNLYPGNSTTALQPVSINGAAKSYALASNTTYYISITGGLSYLCYKLNVNAPQALTLNSRQTQVNEASEELFEVKVFGNPSSSLFNIAVNSTNNERITIRVVDVTGRVIEKLQGLSVSQNIRFGRNYGNGVYFAEVRQGDKTKTVRLVKL